MSSLRINLCLFDNLLLCLNCLISYLLPIGYNTKFLSILARYYKLAITN